MRRESSVLFLLIILAVIIQMSCAVPRYIWPQKDIKTREINDATLEKKVLVASRKSEFKDAVIDKIRESLTKKPVYLKLIGLKDLNNENIKPYGAVVILNTCMAWGMDRKVTSFLKSHEDHQKMIILTTSGDGNWMPEMNGYRFDAISSASEKANVDAVSDEIVQKTLALLQLD